MRTLYLKHDEMLRTCNDIIAYLDAARTQEYHRWPADDAQPHRKQKTCHIGNETFKLNWRG
jgi:hypothetical protein